MAKKQVPQFEVVSSDANGWEEIIANLVDYRHMENQLVMLMSVTKVRTNYTRRDAEDDLDNFISSRLHNGVSQSIHVVYRSKFRNLSFNPDKFYFVVDFQTYNPFHGISDSFDLEE